MGESGEVEIFTLEPAGDDAAQDAAEAEAESLALPYLRRVVEQEGGSIGFRTVTGAPGVGAMLSAVTRLGGQSARNLPKTGIAN